MDQLNQAVSIVLQAGADPQVKQQALEFCSHVQQAPQDWWRPALELSGADNTSEEVHFFCYQVILASLKVFPATSPELEQIRQVVWSRVSQGQLEQRPVTLRTKTAETLGQLFLTTYPQTWPNFFKDLMALKSPDMYLRVLKIVHEEIGDQIFDRNSEEIRQSNALKDAVRANDMKSIIDSLIDLLGSDVTEIIDPTLNVIAGWVSWIDLPMLLAERDGAILPRILSHFNPGDSSRFSALAALNEIIAKKMPPEHKLELIKVTGIIDALKSFSINGQDIEFEERVAKLANTLGLEIVRALASIPQASEPLLLEIMPKILEFLGNEYDDTSIQVVPVISDYIQHIRRDSRRGIPGPLAPERAEVTRAILNKAMMKCAHSEDDNDSAEGGANNSEDTDDSANEEFAELRAKLTQVQEQIASVDVALFLDTVTPFIQSRLSNPSSCSWQQIELALYEMDILGDVAKAAAANQRKIAVGATVQKGSTPPPGGNDIETPATRALYELATALVNSLESFAGNSHPSVQLSCMEFVLKFYTTVFGNKKNTEELLTKTVGFFASSAGIHNRAARVRLRSWYLLFRLFKLVLSQGKCAVPESLAVQVVSSVAPLLPVHIAAEKLDATRQSSPELAIDESANTEEDTIFSSQLYLFELCGMLIGAQQPSKREELARQLLAVLFNNIDGAVTAAKNPSSSMIVQKIAHLRVHHNLIALSAYTRGISSLPGINGSQLDEMVTATQMVVAVVEQLYSDKNVRDAARVAYTRLVELFGARILVEISRLIDILLTNAQPGDLGDILSFLGQLSHRFKDDQGVFDMFSSLSAPLFSKVFGALQVAEADVASEAGTSSVSTEANNRRKELVQAYLQLLHTLINNRFGAVLLPVFENVIESLFHFAPSSSAAGGLPNQKVAITVMCRMTQLWGAQGKIPEDQFAAGESVPLFGDNIMAAKLTELCWTLPTKPDFKLRDAETRLVAMELGALQKTLWDIRGNEYHQYLAAYLSQAGLPQPVIEDFGAKANSSSPKDFKRYFYDLLVRAQS